MQRRHFLIASAAVTAGVALGSLSWWAEALAGEHFAVARSDAEWQRLLGPARYAILRGGSTERPFTSALLHEARRGQFACAGCRAPLFSSQTKFDSGTGWPSFWAPLPHAIRTRADRSYGLTRTEVLCAACGGHLGHVFHDGPAPTGLRYCLNGLALFFQPTSPAPAAFRAL